jgi:hypothetical protein
VPELKLSADGLYYWDGQEWVSTLSADGRTRWNGTAWVPVGGAAPVYVQPASSPRWPTSWTKPLQYAVAGWYVIQAMWAIAVPFFLVGPIVDYMDQVIARNQQLNPDVPPPPTDFIATMSGFITVSLIIGSVVGIAISAVAIIGALKRWTWIYYVILVLLGLGAISLPISFATLFAAPGTLNPVAMPAGITWAQTVIGIPGAALFIWMLVAAVRYGPWAMTRSSQIPSS